MTVKLPVVLKAVCTSCNYVQEVNWSEYGSTSPCIECDEAPAYLVKKGDN